MGANLTRQDSWEDNSSRSGAYSWDNHNQYGYPQPSYGQENRASASSPQPAYQPQPTNVAQPYYYPTLQEFGRVQGRDNQQKFNRRYSRIADNYNSLGEVRMT